MNLNWIDLLLGTLILLSVFAGWRRGFLLEFLDLASWLASLWLGLRFYAPVARWLSSVTDWPDIWGRPAGFLAIFFLSLIVLRLALVKPIAALPANAHMHPVNKVLGFLPGLANGLIHAMIVAILLMALPLPERLQTDARGSALNERLTSYADAVESRLRPVFDDAINETLTMRTVRRPPTESMKLPFSVKESRPLAKLEVQMLALVNQERAKEGLRPLAMDDELTKAARKHSADMLARAYFSHYSPEGKNASDRLRAAKIPFLLAGENLAFAPNLNIAHTGLMNSPGHRANILRSQFRKVGIGIMDAGARGIMVTQKFSN
ncbi:MAG TPA: CvpA family protein [Noviherbaspirillum sp.]|uniref:CvpA family protein n=1 Tax=Noviherbaspirillum sp. TaxID=1926288 RepID=UPI002D503335|nr:CvpA family protein [Noviherbaspirillum sp.]HYD97241.1 CvpA family protein [Noviherbaspirillum sp.]